MIRMTVLRVTDIEMKYTSVTDSKRETVKIFLYFFIIINIIGFTDFFLSQKWNS